MNPARPIPDKVRKLVPLLGSSSDGEALGAARAIGRVLNRGGQGFTDLAAAIPQAGRSRNAKAARPTVQRFSAATIPEFGAYRWRRAYTPRQEAEHRARVRFCQDRPWRLTSWERRFLSNIARLHGNLSIRQGDHLAALTDRLEHEERRAC